MSLNTSDQTRLKAFLQKMSKDYAFQLFPQNSLKTAIH